MASALHHSYLHHRGFRLQNPEKTDNIKKKLSFEVHEPFIIDLYEIR